MYDINQNFKNWFIIGCIGKNTYLKLVLRFDIASLATFSSSSYILLSSDVDSPA